MNVIYIKFRVLVLEMKHPKYLCYRQEFYKNVFFGSLTPKVCKYVENWNSENFSNPIFFFL